MEVIMLSFLSRFLFSAIIISLFFITGCKDDSPNEPEGQSGQTITLNGSVKDIFGQPISGVSVIVKGKSPVITGALGSFTIEKVTTPYEIRLIISSFQTAVIYQGLTKPDPVLLYPQATGSPKSAVISGKVPSTIGKVTKVFFISGSKLFYATANTITGEYSIHAEWWGSEVAYTGKLQVLRWTANLSGIPSQYDAYGSKDLTISNGGTFNDKDFTSSDFSDPAEQSISGSITLPATNYKLTQKSLGLNFENTCMLLAKEFGMDLTGNFSYTVPVISGATFEVDAEAEVPGDSRRTSFQKKCIACGTSGINLILTSAPQLNLPAHNGTGIDTTTQFLWAQGGGSGINYVYIRPIMFGTGPIYYIFTAGNSTSIPNFSPQGLGLPVNKSYSWEVFQVTPLSSIDQTASDTFLNLLNGSSGDLGNSKSDKFNFTTK
jgi:hypothetical protein